MREIKFRVWDVDNKRMFNGAFRLTKKGTETWVSYENQSSENLIWEQYTGLKDKNGNEIYEGDIVFEIYQGKYTYVDTYKKEKLVSLVKQDIVNPCMLLHRQNSSFDSDWEYDFVKCNMLVLEIIGNIHENPELL